MKRTHSTDDVLQNPAAWVSELGQVKSYIGLFYIRNSDQKKKKRKEIKHVPIRTCSTLK
jgi:hypothetical protein